MKKLLIIDGSSLMYRAFFALPPLKNKAGLNTGAVYGFTTMLLKHLQEHNYDYICVAFDKSRITFRNKIYEQYKATRSATPPELSEQFPMIQELLGAFGIYTIQMADYEADDIIGTYAKYAQSQAIQTTILSGDRDLLQLLDTNIQVCLTKKGISEIKSYNVQTFAEEYAGLPPLALIDLKALMGDTSDNIPGIAGIGEKTALKLISEYKTLENLLDNSALIKGKLGEKLQNGKELAVMSQKLATINYQVPLTIDTEQLIIQPNPAQMEELLQKFEFRNLKDRLPDIFLSGATPQQTTPIAELPVCTSATLEDGAAAQKLLSQADPSEPISFSAEYRGEFPQQKLAEFRFLLGHTQYVLQRDFKIVIEYLWQTALTKVTFDFKTFCQACINEGIELTTTEKTFDISIIAYLADATDSSYTPDKLFEKYLINCSDCTLFNIRQVYAKLITQIELADQYNLLNAIEMPLVMVLAKMELCGIKADKTKIIAMGQEMSVEIAALEAKIHELAGEKFNIGSPKQLGAILFDKLMLPIIKKTKTGYSTDIEVLETLESYHEIVPHIIQYRTLTKLYSTYLEGLSSIINPVTGKIHTHFQQTVTTTGRLSSTQPNLQNIPVRTPIGKKIREFFVPSTGYDYLCSFDYSQIELRVLAHMSGDEILIDAFKHGQDIHTRTAAEVFGFELNEVPPEMRSRAKAVNFGIVYGISDYGLSKDLKITRAEAQKYIEGYFHRYKGVKAFINSTIAQAKSDGFVQTLFNRQRYLPDINSSNFNKRSFAERTAMNTPIQGTAADIIKLAMIRADQALSAAKLQSRILLQVHDELVLEVTAAELEQVIPIVTNAMQQVIKLSVDLNVSCNYGTNWAECK